MKNAKSYITWTVASFAALSAMAFNTFAPGEGWQEITVKQYDDLIEKATAYFEGNNITFSVDVTISSFKTHQTTVPYETQQGYFVRSGKNYHHFMMGIHSYQNKNYRFVVDSTERNIMVANPGGSETEKITLSGYNQFHSYITKVYRLESKESNKIRLEFNNKIKVSSIEMEFDKKGMIRKSITYFKMKLKEDPMDKNAVATSPRIETTFRNYKGDIKPDYRKEFDESNYFQVINGKFVAAKGFADYKIKDTRLKTK